MRYEVRQLSFGEILDQSFTVLKDHFVLLVSAMALFYVPYSLLMAPFSKVDQAGLPQTGTLIAAGVGMLALLIFLPLMQLAASSAVAGAYLKTAPSLGDAYKSGLKLYGPYMTTCLLVGLAMFGLVFLLVVPAVYFGICWSLVGPIAVVEGVFGRAALSRSRALVRGYWWRTFGVMFVVGMVVGLVSGGVNMVLASIPFLGPICSGIVQSVGAALGSVTLLVLYVDLRCRHEDFDLQLLANQVAGQPAQPSIPGPVRI